MNDRNDAQGAGLDAADWKAIMVALQDSMILYEKTYGKDEAIHWNTTLRLVQAKCKAALAQLDAATLQPDWRKAPEWAMWWAKEKDGREMWFESEPHLNQKYDWWLASYNKDHSKTQWIEYDNWQTLKRQRPQPDAQERT